MKSMLCLSKSSAMKFSVISYGVSSMISSTHFTLATIARLQRRRQPSSK